MAQFRQSGADRFAVRGHIDPQSSSSAADQISIRVPNKYNHHRIRRPVKPHRRISAAVVGAVTLTLALLVTILSIHHLSRHRQDEDDVENGSYQNQSLPHKELKFGHGSNLIGRDSRYWDRDDRSRDHDYGEEEANATRYQDEHRGNNPIGDEIKKTRDKNVEGGGLYNEGGRAELDAYKEKYETEEANAIDEYDDGVDVDDDHEEEDHDEEDVTHGGDPLISGHDDGRRNLGAADLGVTEKDKSFEATDKVSYGRSKSSGSGPPTKKDNAHTGGELMKLPTSGKKSALKRKPKHHKFSSVSCEMKFLDSAAQLVEPVENKKFSRFSLQYTDTEKWEPRFAGHQTLQEREASFYAHNQRINCGFIQGPSRSASTGFDLAEDDLKFMSSCHIAVSSCIFGNSDHLRSPFGKMITRQSRKNVCFVMFVDQVTLETLSSEGQGMDSMGFIGLWKIVVVKNMPYSDMRRVGKIPKFLAHRLFPSARYSIWLDSKLRLQKDPYLILEYFLWRRGYEYAISNHYDRHCVWEEVLQNKKLNKFNHTIIDQQFEFYQSDGLKRFDPSDPNKLLPSYVPEGSFIVRAHTPMSNLFSCLWFNEVDRFTPRDQLSFAYTYLKLRSMNPQKTFHLNMFKDCQRRSIAKLFRHRAEEKPAVPTHAAD